MGLLDGKVAIVTGGGKGIGRAHCFALAAEGARVVVNDLGREEGPDGVVIWSADLVVDALRERGVEALSNHDSVSEWGSAKKIIDAAKNHFGRLDILVNNAGILRDKPLLRMNEEAWDEVIDVHLKGTFLCTRHAAALMRRQGEGGRIINTSSLTGLIGNAGQSNYGAAKAGIYGLTRVVSLELARYKVTVNAIAPIALTDMTRKLGIVPEHMTSERVSPIVVFLASPLADDITGRVFGVHGNEIFEYRMEQSPAIDKPEGLWTPQEIAAKIGALTPSRDA